MSCRWPPLLLIACLTLVGLSPASAGPAQLADAREAAKRAGQRVFVAVWSSMPAAMMRPLREHARERHERGGGKTTMFWMPTAATPDNFNADAAHYLDNRLLFVSQNNREAASQGLAHPIDGKNSLFQLAQRITAGELELDTVIVRVSRPNAAGEVSLGPAADLTMAAIENVQSNGGRIIAEVHPGIPFTAGSNRLQLDQLDSYYQAEADKTPIIGYSAGASTPLTREIATHIAALIPEDTLHTLQVGIGSATIDLGQTLGSKRLVARSELGTSEWVLPLMQGEQPAIEKGVFAMLLGDDALYGWAHDNPRIEMQPCSTVNDPRAIAAIPNFVAVNCALEVDLAAHANAEQIGGRRVSMPGGQPDFMSGAIESPGGKAIIALRSTNKLGQSTIVADLAGRVTTGGELVSHVVTEWGATADLRQLDGPARAHQLLRVAHPLLRSELAAVGRARGLISEEAARDIAATVYASIAAAPLQLRSYLANEGHQRGLLSEADYRRVIDSLAGQPPSEYEGTIPPLQPRATKQAPSSPPANPAPEARRGSAPSWSTKAPDPSPALLERYLAQAALPEPLSQPRELVVGTEAHPIKRTAVAVTPDSADLFLSLFSQENGFVSIRYRGDDTHTGLLVEPRTLYFHGGYRKGAPLKRWYDWHFPITHGGELWPIFIGTDGLAHLKQWLDQQSFEDHCMAWLPNAQIAPGLGLFAALEIKRARKGDAMRAKLNHAANHRLPIVGVCVTPEQIAQGYSLSQPPPEQLLGPRPGGGDIAEAQHRLGAANVASKVTELSPEAERAALQQLFEAEKEAQLGAVELAGERSFGAIQTLEVAGGNLNWGTAQMMLDPTGTRLVHVRNGFGMHWTAGDHQTVGRPWRNEEWNGRDAFQDFERGWMSYSERVGVKVRQNGD